MSDNLTTTTQVDPAISTFYDRLLLKRAQPKLIHTLFADRKNLPSKSGNTVKFRRYSALTTATTKLNEGVTPPGQRLAKTDLTCTVSQYGDFVHLTDVVNLTVQDPVLAVAVEELGIQMGKTIDEIVRDTLAACASSTNCTGGSNGETPTELHATGIKAVLKTMYNNDADMITPLIKASTGVGTAPTRPAYMVLAHSYLMNDLENVTGFQPTSQYPAQLGVYDAEWGSVLNSRWLLSSVGHRNTTASPDQFYCMFIGKHAYGIVDLTEGNVKSIVKAYGSAGTADPIDQRATAGWKAMFVTRILNDNFMHILKVTGSDSVDS